MDQREKEILKDMEEIYSLGLAKESYAVALRAKELLGREVGLFKQKNPSALKNVKEGLLNLSDEDLQKLIKELEVELNLDPTP